MGKAKEPNSKPGSITSRSRVINRLDIHNKRGVQNGNAYHDGAREGRALLRPIPIVYQTNKTSLTPTATEDNVTTEHDVDGMASWKTDRSERGAGVLRMAKNSSLLVPSNMIQHIIPGCGGVGAQTSTVGAQGP